MEANLTLGCLRCSPERAAVTSLTNPHYITGVLLFIFRPPQTYETIEMLILPLGDKIWIGIILVEIIAVTITIFTYRYKRAWYNLISPYPCDKSLMNNFAVFMGLPTRDKTRKSFSRFLLIMWLLFTFIIRNSYLARLFDLLTMEHEFNLPKGFSDLLRMGYNLLMTNMSYDAIRNVSGATQFEMETVSLLSEWDFLKYMLERKEKYFKSAGITPADYVKLYSRYYGYEEEIYILPDILFNQQLCIYFSKHSMLVHRIDYILLNLRSMGLIFYWAQRRLRIQPKSKSTREDADEALHFYDISGILYLTISGLVFSWLVFMVELVLGYYKRKKKVKRPRRPKRVCT